jgi:hypothetical protein
MMNVTPFVVVRCWVSLILAASCQVFAADRCQKAVTDAVADAMCRHLLSAVKTSQPPAAIREGALRVVASQVEVGQTGTFGETDGCYEISRIQIRLFAESQNQKLVDEFIDLGDQLERDIIHVVESQIQDDTETEEYYVSASLQVFLKKSDAINIELSADLQNLEVGDSERLDARILCSRCPLSDREITFSTIGPGQIEPRHRTTGKDGRTWTTVTATGNGTVMVLASFLGYHAELELNVSRLVSTWDVTFTISQSREDRASNDDLRYAERWTSEVRFEEILFTEKTPLDQISPLDMFKLHPLLTDREKKGPYYRAEGVFSQEEYIDYWRKKNLKKHFKGRRQGEPTWIFMPSVDCHLENGLASHSGECLAAFSVRLWEGLPREYPIKVFFGPDYFRSFSPFGCEVTFPFQKILDGEPFMVTHHEHGWRELRVDVHMVPRG